MKAKTKKIIQIGLGLAIVAALLVPNLLKGGAGGPGGGPGGGMPGGQAGGAGAATAFSVKTQKVQTGQLQTYLELTGDVSTDTNVDVYPDVGGRLSAVLVKVGDGVVRGETVIAEVDPSKPGSNYSLSPVYSPISGTVTSLSAQRGATVSTATSLATVGTLGRLLIDVQVPETDIANLRLGLLAEVSFSAYPGLKFSAVVDRLSPVVDSVSRTKKIRLRFLAEDKRINVGMFAQVKLLFDPQPSHVLVPSGAILTQSGKTVVYLADGQSAARREVAVGQSSDGVSEVVSGLRAGDEVVVKGQELLDDGAKIRVVGASAGGQP